MSDNQSKPRLQASRRELLVPAAILDTHDFWLYDLAFAPDGRTLAVGTKKGRGVSLFNTDDWTRRGTLVEVNAPPSDLAFSANASAITLTTDTAPARIWDAASGKLRWSQPGRCSLVRFSPDGKLLAAVCQGTAQVFDTATGHQVRTLAGHKQEISGLAFSGDGAALASSDGRTICLWNLKSGRLQRRVQVRAPYVARIGFAPGSQLLTGLDFAGTLRIWDAAKEKWQGELPVQAACNEKLVWSRDGCRLVTCGKTDGVRVWDIFAGIQIACLNMPGARAFVRPAISPDGALVAALADAPGNLLVVWQLATPAAAAVIPLPDQGHRVAFSPDAHWLAVATHDGKTRVWDVRPEAGFPPEAQRPVMEAPRRDAEAKAPSKPVETEADELLRKASSPPAAFTLKEDLYPFVFSPDGRLFAGAGEGLHLFDTPTWNPRAPIPLKGVCLHLTFQPGGEGLAAATSAGCLFWKTPDECETWLLRGTGRHVTFAKDGRSAAFAVGKSMVVVDVATGKPRFEDKPFRKQAEWTVISASGKYLAASGWTQVCVRALPEGRLVALQDKEGRVLAIAFSPREDLLAVATEQGVIRLWDVANRRLRGVIKTDPNATFGMDFSPDGRFIAASGLTGVVEVWDVNSGRSLACLGKRSEVITHAAFSPDGKWLVTAEEFPAHLVSVWNTRTWKLAARIQSVPYAAQVVVSPDNRWLAVKVHEGVRIWDFRKLLKAAK